MNAECCIKDVKAIFQIILEHARAVDELGRPKPAKLARWSSWLAGTGVWVAAIGLIAAHALRATGEHRELLIGAVVLAAGGLVVMLIGTVLLVIDSVRTMRSPLMDHVVHLLDALPRETQLVARLTRFDSYSLEFARRRLEVESNKVLSRLDLIGGDGILKPSLLGIGVVFVSLAVSYRDTDLSGLSFALFSVFGLALVAGMSIGALHAKSGARRADFYVGMLSLAVDSKAHGRASGEIGGPQRSSC